MDEGTKEALCKHVADVLCSKDVNIESQVLSKICDEFLITDRELMLFSRHFKALDTDHSGQVDVREFTRYYKLESQLAMAERAFLAFDVDNTRDVDLTEYIGALGRSIWDKFIGDPFGAEVEGKHSELFNLCILGEDLLEQFTVDREARRL